MIQELEPVSILMVDDHPENLMALRAILEGPDYRLVTANSGADALKQLLRQEFALILLDVMMPDMDGYEVATRIKQRERDRNTPIIFLTAVAKDVEHIFKGYASGAVDYLSKPLAAEVVRAKVEIFVDLYKQKKEIERQAALLAEKERREKELELAELRLSEQRRFKALADSIPEIVWSSGPDGKVNYANERWHQYAGVAGSADERLKRVDWTDSLHPDEHERIVSSWQASMKSGKEFETEFRLRRAEDGTYRWHLARAIPTRNTKGEIVEWFGASTDIDAQKNCEIELASTLRARDEFFSIASHELKTPITSLKLGLQALDRGLTRNGSEHVAVTLVREKLSTALRQIDRMGKLVENLLDVSRIRSHRLMIETEKLDVCALIRDVSARLAIQAQESGSPFHLILPEVAIEGDFDRVRVEQVLTNLLTNAIKYGKGKPIEIRLEYDNESVELRITDHGIGISAEDQERIFGYFERAVTLKDFTGLGLGLYITQQIVKAHGGEIRVSSTLGQGSVFSIVLPRTASQAAIAS